MALIEMKRLRAVALQSQRRALLRQLRRLGCVEVETAAESSDFAGEEALPQTVAEDTGAQENWAALTQALQTLDQYAPPEKRPLFAAKPQMTQGQFYDEQVLHQAVQAAQQINGAVQEMNRLAAEQSRLEAARIQLGPWKDLDVPLDYVHEGPVTYYQGVLPAAADLRQLEATLEEQAPASQLEEVSSDSEQHYVTLLAHDSCKEEALAAIKQQGFSPFAMRDAKGTAAQWSAKLQQDIDAMERQRQQLAESIGQHRQDRAAIEQAIDAYALAAEEDRLLSGMARTKDTVVLTGWLPQKAQPKVEAILEKYGCAFSLEDPQEGEDPPTAMENGAVAEPFGAITAMYGMPAYGSLVDPNPLMAPFYITFFGFIMGDVVYGALISLICMLGLKLMRPKGTMRQMLTLFFYCGLSTMVAGVLVGGWLGDTIPVFTKAVLGKEYSIPPLWFNPLDEPMKMLMLSMAMGAVQILTGMAVSAWRQIKQGQWLDALVDTGSWYLVFAGAGMAVLGLSFGVWIAVVGVAHWTHHRRPGQSLWHHRVRLRPALLLPHHGPEPFGRRGRVCGQPNGRYGRRRYSGRSDLCGGGHCGPYVQLGHQRAERLRAYQPFAVYRVLRPILRRRRPDDDAVGK